jgi:hypothetical protein
MLYAVLWYIVITHALTEWLSKSNTHEALVMYMITQLSSRYTALLQEQLLQVQLVQATL